MSKYLTEFIGTFFLVFTIGMASGSLAPLAIGSVLMVMIFMGGHVSGGHYNPAVTLGVFLRGRCDAKDVGPYMIAQVVGALLAAATATWLTGSAFGPKPADGKILEALVVELIFTFALVLVVLNVATSRDNANNSFYGLAIGFTVFAGAVSVGPISGGGFNPAVGIGPALVDLIKGGDRIASVWIYLLAPFAGGVLAAIVFRAQNPNDP